MHIFFDCSQVETPQVVAPILKSQLMENPKLINQKKTLSNLEVFCMILYFILIFALCLWSLFCYFLIFLIKDESVSFFKELWRFLSFQSEGYLFNVSLCFCFGYIGILLGTITIIFTIISLILGIKNADTKNGASKWRSFLSYLSFGKF